MGKLKKKTFLVTGGTGFIGSNICRMLIKNGYNVIIYDNNSRGNLTKINFQSLNFAYIINPYTNFKINIGVTIRDFNSSEGQLKHKFINFGIISDLFNHYYDI